MCCFRYLLNELFDHKFPFLVGRIRVLQSLNYFPFDIFMFPFLVGRIRVSLSGGLNALKEGFPFLVGRIRVVEKHVS